MRVPCRTCPWFKSDECHRHPGWVGRTHKGIDPYGPGKIFSGTFTRRLRADLDDFNSVKVKSTFLITTLILFFCDFFHPIDHTIFGFRIGYNLHKPTFRSSTMPVLCGYVQEDFSASQSKLFNHVLNCLFLINGDKFHGNFQLLFNLLRQPSLLLLYISFIFSDKVFQTAKITSVSGKREPGYWSRLSTRAGHLWRQFCPLAGWLKCRT